MNVSAIREGLAALLAGIPSIKGSSGYPPEGVGAVPFAFVGFFDDAPTMGNRELHLYSFPVTVLVQRKGANLASEVRAVETVIPELLAAIRADQDLGLIDVYHVAPTRITEGVFSFAGTEYTGFVATIEVKESFGVSYD